MDTTILGVTNDKHRDTKMANRTTLNPNYPCDKCGEPAMVAEGGWLRCLVVGWQKKESK